MQAMKKGMVRKRSSFFCVCRENDQDCFCVRMCACFVEKVNPALSPKRVNVSGRASVQGIPRRSPSANAVTCGRFVVRI
jgi:hypothetical protein